MTKKISYQDAMARDKLLYELSMYDLCGGMMRIIKSEEDYMEFNQKIFDRFNFYKRLIQIGEYTFDELVNDILSRNAAIKIENKKINLNSDKDINNIISKFEKDIEEKEKSPVNDFLNSMRELGLLFGEGKPNIKEQDIKDIINKNSDNEYNIGNESIDGGNIDDKEEDTTERYSDIINEKPKKTEDQGKPIKSPKRGRKKKN